MGTILGRDLKADSGVNVPGNLKNPQAVKEVLAGKRKVANAVWWGFNERTPADLSAFGGWYWGGMCKYSSGDRGIIGCPPVCTLQS